MSIEYDERPDNGLDDRKMREALIPPELMDSLHFEEFESSVRPRYSMKFVLNGKNYHFDGVITALATAHKEKKTNELNQLAALPGIIIRLCYNFSGVQKEYFLPKALVHDSASWVSVLDEKDQ